ncbi:MAG: serine/threonine protein kinase [Ktedonobacteraceae bacterium]
MSSENSFIGKSLGNYRITAEIGSGSFGNVYQGQHTILTERTVAIKQLHSHLGSPEERDRFLEEARLLERLKHPHILHIFDVGIYEGFPYLVAEYASGGSLRDHLSKYAPNLLPIKEALAILSQVGQGLYYAHQRSVIHRDLKPANILFNAQGEALLADFGIATTLSTSSITHAAIMGTPPYMAPEQFQGSVSKESDQYALGCIAYELFTGKTPFSATDFFALGFEHLTKQPVVPTQLNPLLPVHIEQAILKALAKQRGDRHADVKAFIMALQTPDDEQFLMSTIPTPHPISTLDYSHGPTINHEQLFKPQKAAMEQKLQTNIPHTAGLEAQITQKTHLPYNQAPETPLPPVNTSFLNTIDAGRGPVTPIPLSQESITGVTKPIPLSISMATATTQAEKKGNIWRKWALVVVAVLLVIAGNIGVFYYLFSRQSNTNNISTRQSLTTNRGGTSTIGQNVPTNPLTPVPTHGPKTVITLVTNGSTATAINATTTTTTPSPTPTPVSDTLTVYFINGTNGVSTTHSYKGQVTITVSGAGEESKNKWVDAFYSYTDSSGNPTTPTHTSTYPGWGLWINGGVADNYVQPIPSYNSNHYYSFTINAPGGYLTFAIGDTYTKDNSGYLSLTVTQQN